jgi:uncharacterized membrane protein SirB2
LTEFYLPLLMFHVALAIASPILFSIRALRAISGENPAEGWLRIVPHAVDTLLFLAGLTLALMLRQYPFAQGWLTAKLLALLAYIALGHIAVRRARSRHGRMAAYALAIGALLYIYAVAVTKSPTLAIG